MLLFVLTFTMPWWVSAPLMLLYMIRYTAYEVIVLGALYDAAFGVFIGPMPFLYTIVIGVCFVLLELLKPYLSFYRETH